MHCLLHSFQQSVVTQDEILLDSPLNLLKSEKVFYQVLNCLISNSSLFVSHRYDLEGVT